MSETTIEQIDVTRATAVLNIAMSNGMFPQGAMPEGDAAKIVEAEKLIELARQAEAVAEQVGKQNLPHWPVIQSILFEANTGLGITEPPAQPAVPSTAPPTPAPVVPPSPAQGGFAGPGPHLDPDPLRCSAVDRATGEQCELGVGHDGMHHATGFGFDSFLDDSTRSQSPAPPAPPAAPPVPATPPAPPAASPAPAPAPDPTADVVMAKGQTWLDSQGQQWLILAYGGGPQVQARLVKTGEETLLPSGFLKQIVPEQPAVPPAPPVPPTPPPAPTAPEPQHDPQLVAEVEAGAHTMDTEDAKRDTAYRAVVSATNPEPGAASGGAAVAEGFVEGPPAPPARYESQMLAVPEEDDEGDDAYANVLAKVAENFMPVALPAPQDLEHPPTNIPEDLTAVDDIEQRRLHSQFNALSSRTRYLHGIESARARACDRVYRHHLRGAMKVVRREMGKDASVTEVQQEAEEHPNVALWLERRIKHAERAEALKVFLANYMENVAVLSRDYTMRAREEQGS